MIDGTLGMAPPEAVLLAVRQPGVIEYRPGPAGPPPSRGASGTLPGERFVPVPRSHDEIRPQRHGNRRRVQRMTASLLDLGVSLPCATGRTRRGFAYSYYAPLDMRMNSEDLSSPRVNGQQVQRGPRLRRIIRN